MGKNSDRRRLSRIGLVQTTTRDDAGENLRYAVTQVEAAARAGVHLVAFPEVFLFVGGREDKLANAQPLEGEWVSTFRNLAREHGLWILMGSFHERIPERSDKVHNTSVLIDASGEIAGVYRKLKLFDVDLPGNPIRESATIVPGDTLPPVVSSPFGAIGMTICFDLRFPELYRHLRAGGAELVFVPSNFTALTGAAHWDVLLRARAIENQVYIMAPAQVGRLSERSTSHGHSAIVDPWGGMNVVAPDRPGLVVGEVDLDYLEEVRRTLPVGAGQA